MQAPGTKPRMFKVMIPIEKKDGGTFWMRIGTGFPGKDPSSFNLYLDALPVNQKMLHVRELDEEELQRNDARRAERRAPAAEPRRADDLPF